MSGRLDTKAIGEAAYYYPVNDLLRDWGPRLFRDSDGRCLIYRHVVINQGSVLSGSVFHVIAHRNWGRDERGVRRLVVDLPNATTRVGASPRLTRGLRRAACGWAAGGQWSLCALDD